MAGKASMKDDLERLKNLLFVFEILLFNDKTIWQLLPNM